MCTIADAQNKEKLTVGLLVPINVLYPWGQIILEPQYVMENIYETLMRAKESSMEVEPCLAARLDASPDYKVWTAYLRKDVKFHDGTPLTADSVVESLSLQGSLKGKVAKIDAHTVVFSLDKPDATFPMTLSIPYYSIASLATINCYRKKCMPPVIIGTGPFKLENWRPPTNIVLSANEAYWGNKTFFKKIEFISFNSDQTCCKH